MFTRNFSRLTARAAALALGLTLLLATARARAAGPDLLPASAVADNTFVVATLNLAKLDPASLDAAAKAVLGANAALAQQGLDKYKAKYTEFTGAGAESLTFVMSGDPDKSPEPVVYVRLKPGSDHAVVEKKIREEQAKPENKGEQMDIAHDGDFVVLHKQGTELPKGSAADRAKAFSDVLGASDKAFTLVFNPTDAIRTKMKADAQRDAAQQPAWLQAAVPAITDAKWVSLDATLGDSPTLGVTVQAADDAGAKSINDAVTQGSQQLKAQAAQMQQGGAQFAPMATAMSGLADALKPTQSGSKVSLSIDGKTVGPLVSNFIPFLLMGGGGGAGPKPGGGL